MGAGIQTITIKGWAQLEELLFGDEWPELNRHRTKRVFRGLTDSTFALTTTLQRMRGRSSELEPKLLRQFKKYAHRDLITEETDWHCLAIAQHHGLPTRLLDWTNSPFVALHFATADWPNSGTDAAIWALNFTSIRQWLPDILNNQLAELGVNVFTTAELAAIVPSVDKLQSLEDEHKGEFLTLFEPPSLDDRIVNQYAALSVLSRADRTPEDWLNNRPYGVCEKLIIPRHLKATIRERLDMMNITERVLYPGLDGLTTWLKRYYGPKWPNPNQPQPVFNGRHLNIFRSPTG